MKILMIGGTGFIGAQVVAQLAGQHDVTVLHRGRHGKALPRMVRAITGDRDQLSDLAHHLRRDPPEVVLDMIAGDERQARRVLEAFRGIARRLVTLSSIDVYRAYEVALGLSPGPLEPVPLTEDAPLRTVLHPYKNRPAGSIPFDWVTPDYDKILVEHAVGSEPTLSATILRLPMVYGPGDPLHRFHAFLKRMDDGRPAIYIEETWARWKGAFGYVENVAAAIALAVTSDQAAGRIYNIAESDPLTWAEWAAAVGEAAGWHGRIVILPCDRTPKHLLPNFRAEQHWTADSRSIRRELGFREPVSRAAALARTVVWERANPAAFDPAAFDYEAEKILD